MSRKPKRNWIRIDIDIDGQLDGELSKVVEYLQNKLKEVEEKGYKNVMTQ